eukprot:1390770-Amphidinium_carterae.1
MLNSSTSVPSLAAHGCLDLGALLSCRTAEMQQQLPCSGNSSDSSSSSSSSSYDGAWGSFTDGVGSMKDTALKGPMAAAEMIPIAQAL